MHNKLGTANSAALQKPKLSQTYLLRLDHYMLLSMQSHSLEYPLGISQKFGYNWTCLTKHIQSTVSSTQIICSAETTQILKLLVWREIAMTFLDVEKRECEVNISLVVVVKVVMVRGGQWVKKLSFLKQWIFLS